MSRVARVNCPGLETSGTRCSPYIDERMNLRRECALVGDWNLVKFIRARVDRERSVVSKWRAKDDGVQAFGNRPYARRETGPRERPDSSTPRGEVFRKRGLDEVRGPRRCGGMARRRGRRVGEGGEREKNEERRASWNGKKSRGDTYSPVARLIRVSLKPRYVHKLQSI